MCSVSIKMTVAISDDIVLENFGESTAELEIIEEQGDCILTVSRSKNDGIDIRIPDECRSEVAEMIA